MHTTIQPLQRSDQPAKPQYLIWFLTLFVAIVSAGCSSSESTQPLPAIVVNSPQDMAAPPEGTVTLRSALASAASNQVIVFDQSLNGATIELSIVGEDHTILKGEVMGMRDEPSGPVSYLVGYFDRDYGRSALYARKNVVIDASGLPSGITLAWVGGAGNQARVLAVYGNLTMTNVAVTGGHSITEDISTGNPDDQPWTLARGGAIAVWGIAQLVNCRLYDNHCQGDFDSSRDRGAFGGGLYANMVNLTDCVISGNTVLGGGAAGGGVFSVGGAGIAASTATIERSSITGNRISGLFTYGGGVYSDGGGIGNRKTMVLTNVTIARNIVEPPPGMPAFLLEMGYWRGGGIYMSNGYLTIRACTVVENEVYGVPRTDRLDKPNLAGGIASTIGNAHAVEDLTISHSIVTGNTVHEIGGSSYDQDIFTGSLFYFKSKGYNRFGVLDFSQMLVPVGQWNWLSLCRRHFPKQGDMDGIAVADVLDLAGGITRSGTILSAGVDAPDPAVLHYAPMAGALDQVLPSVYNISETYADYAIIAGATNNFLVILLDRIEAHFGLVGFADDFTAAFEAFLQTVDADDATVGVQPYTNPEGDPILTLTATQWFGPAQTWPQQLYNYPYIEFWHRLDSALADEIIPGMGPELLGDDAWTALFTSGTLTENSAITMRINTVASSVDLMTESDQVGTQRPLGTHGDIGAIEIP